MDILSNILDNEKLFELYSKLEGVSAFLISEKERRSLYDTKLKQEIAKERARQKTELDKIKKIIAESKAKKSNGNLGDLLGDLINSEQCKRDKATKNILLMYSRESEIRARASRNFKALVSTILLNDLVKDKGPAKKLV